MDPQTAGKCKLCGKNSICKNCRGLINGKSVCNACKDQILAELDAEKADTSHLPLALAAGAIAAFASGIVWAAIAVIAGVHIGYVAIGVGYLAGQGVYFGSGKRKGVNLQYAAIGCALLGLFLGKLFTGVGLIVQMAPTSYSYTDGRVYSLVLDNFDKMLSPFDLLWIFIALRMAWKVPKPVEMKVK
jgi:hypothetical protein